MNRRKTTFDITDRRINNQVEFSTCLYQNYFFPLQAQIISTHALLGHCIIVGYVDGQRERVCLNFRSVDTARVLHDNNNDAEASDNDNN